jgi:hypothetical protein
MLSNFEYIYPKGIGRGESCSWFLWQALFKLISSWFSGRLVGWFAIKGLAKLILDI